MIRRILLLLVVLPWLAGCAPERDEAARLHDLFAREWQTRLREDPLLATAVGVHDYDDRLPDMSPRDLQRRDELSKDILNELTGIDRSRLSDADRINLEIFGTQLRNRIAHHRFGLHEIPFTADSGFHTGFARLPFEVPLDTAADYDNYLSRLNQWPRYVDEQIALMRSGIERGMTQPRAVLDGIEDTMAAHVVDDAAQSVFWEPFDRFPRSVPVPEHDRLQQAGRRAILESIVPGYRKLHDFFVSEYVPGARQTLGAADLPNGPEYYRQRITEFTSLDLTPEEIHEIGLAEVERIHGEMLEIIDAVGFEDGFEAFLGFLRTDPRFYARTSEELLQRAAYITKTMDGKLPALFKTMPRLPYTVEAVPEDLAPKYTVGRYVPAPIGSTRPGKYWVNTYALDTRPLYNMEALSLHEAVPGHHLQIALNQELESLPNFRRHSYISAFGEGWGLYSEWLGLEAGFYTDPYSDFGRLTYEMWRACRLVVDTGVHAMGWTREQMLDYLASHTALSLHEITTETDRYISWPGQALAYKLGEMKIRELRRRAEDRLGDRFDVRGFHDAVLLNGSVPLDVLERIVDRWIEQQARAS